MESWALCSMHPWTNDSQDGSLLALGYDKGLLEAKSWGWGWGWSDWTGRLDDWTGVAGWTGGGWSEWSGLGDWTHLRRLGVVGLGVEHQLKAVAVRRQTAVASAGCSWVDDPSRTGAKKIVPSTFIPDAAFCWASIHPQLLQSRAGCVSCEGPGKPFFGVGWKISSFSWQMGSL